MLATLPYGTVHLPQAVPVEKIVIVESCTSQCALGPLGLSAFSVWFVPAPLSACLGEIQILQLKLIQHGRPFFMREVLARVLQPFVPKWLDLCGCVSFPLAIP